MSVNQYYSGPGKVYFNSPYDGGYMLSFQAADANGAIQCVVDEKTTTRGAAMFGDMFETTTDLVGHITFTPFSDWGLLPHLFPTYLGVTTNGKVSNAGALSVGTYAHDPTAAGASVFPVQLGGVWAYDGSEYNFVRTAITKHPTVKLGASMPLYGSTELTAIGAFNVNPGTSGFLMSTTSGSATGAPITEPGPGVPDPSLAYTFPYTAFTEQHWTGKWGGPVSPFPSLMEAEDGWDIVPDIKYNIITVQKVTRAFVLASARFMIKARLVDPTHTAILSRTLAHQAGAPMPQSTTAQNLVLTSDGGIAGQKTVSLYNCEIRGAGFEFGGTKLRTGEIAFVATATPSSSVTTTSSLVFSA
jgi:hypothetical protein